MEKTDLEKLNVHFISITENKLKNLLSSRSENENKILRMKENTSIWSNFLKNEINNIETEFVAELNTEKFSRFSIKDREKANDSFIKEIKALILLFNRKFILNE